MATITIKISDNALEAAQELADEQHDGNRSAALRELIDNGLDYDALETENERLQRQLTAANRRYDEHSELVEYVEEERSITRQRAQAGITTRLKWWVTGMPDEHATD